MKFLRSFFLVFALAVFSFSVFAEEVQEFNLLEDFIEESSLNQLVTYSGKDAQKLRRFEKDKYRGKGALYFSSISNFKSSKSVFFQTNVGIGFLYFSGLRGNLMGRPVAIFVPASLWRDAPLKGRLSSNPTPLFEYLLGYRFNPWLKLALSYQHQGGIAIQSKAVSSFSSRASDFVQFTSNLSLDAILAKVYFELPYGIVWKKLFVQPYLAVGVGPGWQSWTRLQVSYMRGNTTFAKELLTLRQKTSANAVWMGDVGLRLQSTTPSNSFSMLLGCKYNQWGQARSMGKMSQQGPHKISITQPLRIKTVYQFAPYLGVQWNFMPNSYPAASYKLKGRSPQVWLPYWAASREFQCSRSIWTQFNVGIGFLYFSNLRGNLAGKAIMRFSPTYRGTYNSSRFQGRLRYNRTPLFEYLLGYHFNPWLKLAFSYQHQGEVTIQNKPLPDLSAADARTAQFTSNLSLDAFLMKFYFELPYAMIWRNLSINPYLATGVGPGWQSWTQTQTNYMSLASQNQNQFWGNPFFLRSKFCANAVWMIDLGLRVQSAFPSNTFSMVMGCKYNQWGQARNIGKLSQQGSNKVGLLFPMRIKTVYQFAPYLGVQWNFSPDLSSGQSYKLKGRAPKVWLPYWLSSKEFQCSKSIWTQFNAGIGFLYFSGLRGNLMGKPVLNFRPNSNWRDVPLKGRLSYNRTPLFEYLVGYRFNSWLKLSLSYQHQSGISIRSKLLYPYPATILYGTDIKNRVAFAANLSLNAVLAKVYFELPYAMIWRSLSTNPYLAVGVGPSWQSWTQVNNRFTVESDDDAWFSNLLPFRQKISANAVWMVDAGLRIQSAYPNSKFSVLLGCKYNQWGQARSMGKMSQQGAHKLALGHPVIIKTVYQFAPYLGVQWNF